MSDAFLGSRLIYARAGLDESMLLESPFDMLRQWLDEATDESVKEPTAMVISTATKEGKPSARVVLMRGLDERGLTFYTNYESRKGHELAENPWASATFWWALLERQIRIEGRVERVSKEESDAYFATRRPDSQHASAASPQSQVVASREALIALTKAVADQYPDAMPRPEHWGGYRLIPTRFEFWQGRPARLHDRLIYEKTEDGWKTSRLAS